MHGDRHDRRIVRIEVLNDRLVDVGRQRATNAGHLGLHVLLRNTDIDAQVERHAHVRRYRFAAARWNPGFSRLRRLGLD